MDGLEFTEKLIGHLVTLVVAFAWPSAVVFLLWTQKGSIGELIGRVKEVEAGKDGLKVKAAEKKFVEDVKIVKADVEMLEATPVEPPKLQVPLEAITGVGAAVQAPNITAAHGVVEPVPIKPKVGTGFEEYGLRTSSVVAGNWAWLEDTIRQIGSGHGIPYWDEKHIEDHSFKSVLDKLLAEHVIRKPTYDLALELHALRNDVVRSEIEPPRAAANGFVQSCKKLEQRLLVEETAWRETMASLLTQWKNGNSPKASGLEAK